MTERQRKATHFGFEEVAEEEKATRVAGVFDSVASRYDLMNDVMSVGLHRVWKAFAVRQANVRPGMKVLDIAGGTGDLAKAFAQRAGTSGEVWLTDINGSMLAEGRDRMLDAGLTLPLAQCDAEKLPFPSAHFDLVSVAFGLRNMTHKDVALAEMARVLRPGGRLLVLEFSRIWQPLGATVRCLLLQRASLARQEARWRQRQLPLPRRVDTHAPATGRARADDGTCRLRSGPMVQPDGGRVCPACRHQVLNLEIA